MVKFAYTTTTTSDNEQGSEYRNAEAKRMDHVQLHNGRTTNGGQSVEQSDLPFLDVLDPSSNVI
jgi:hypothetical protein